MMYPATHRTKLEDFVHTGMRRSSSTSNSITIPFNQNLFQKQQQQELHQQQQHHVPSASFEGSLSQVRMEVEKQLLSQHRGEKPPLVSVLKTPTKKHRSSSSASSSGFLPYQKVLFSIEAENSRLKSEVSNLESNLEQKNNTKTIFGQLKDHSEEMKEISEKVNDLDRDNRKLRAVVKKLYIAEDTSDELQNMKKQYAVLNAAHSQLINEANLISSAYESVKEEKERFYKKCVVLTKKLKTLAAQHNIVEKDQLKEVEDQRRYYEDELRRANQNSNQFEEEQHRLREALRKMQADITYWKEEATKKDDLLRKSNHQQQTLEQRMQELEDMYVQDKERLLQESSLNTTKYRQLEVELSKAHDVMKALKEKYRVEVDAAERKGFDQIAELTAKLHSLTARADILAKREQEHRREVDAKEAHEDKDQLIVSLKEEVSKRESELQRTFANLNHVNELLSTCQVQLENEILRRMQVSDEKDQLQDEMTAIQVEIKQYKFSLENFKLSLAGSQSEISMTPKQRSQYSQLVMPVSLRDENHGLSKSAVITASSRQNQQHAISPQLSQSDRKPKQQQQHNHHHSIKQLESQHQIMVQAYSASKQRIFP